MARTKQEAEELKARLTQFLTLNLAQMQVDFDELSSPRDRLDFITKILPYAVPKMQGLEVEGSINTNTVSSALADLRDVQARQKAKNKNS